MSPFFVFLLLFTVFSLALHDALGLVGDTQKEFGVEGNVRTLGAVIDNYDYPLFFGPGNDVDFLSKSLLRLIVAGKPSAYFSYELHGVEDFSAATASQQNATGIGGGGFSSNLSRYQALDATWHWLDEEHLSASLWLDRLNTRFSLPLGDLTLGRQAITFGKTYFWNPLDVFSPFASDQIDRDYKPGVDAARLDIPFNAFSGVNMVGAMGRTFLPSGMLQNVDEDFDTSWYGSALLGRAYTTLKKWDLAVEGGKVYAGELIGVEGVGEWGAVQVRGEVAYHFVRDDPLLNDAFFVVAGAGHRFENTLDLQMEYFWNQRGSENWDLAFLRQKSGDSLQMSEHVLGFSASYEIMPILVARMGTLFSPLSSPSAQLQPLLTLSLSDEAEVLLGALINLGERPKGPTPTGLGIQSEFGTYQDLYFAELKYFF